MKEEGQPLDFRYEPHLDLRRTFVDPENERQTYHSYAFFGLKSSIAKRRVLVPIGVEERPGTGEYKGRTVYHVIYGNRRTLASKSLHLSTIPAKVYRNLTEEQRHLMQVAENSTKVKIPAHETAQNLWGYYLFLLSEESKGKYPLE
jgi:ParB/RepB/Spo0J family partition protein